MASIESEETTSAESFSSTECEICTKELCKRKSAGIPNICEKCSVELASMDHSCQMKSESLQDHNKKSMTEIFNAFKSLQSIRDEMMERVKDFGEIWKINRKFSALKRDYNDSVRVLVMRSSEKEALCRVLNEKQVILNEKFQEMLKMEKIIKDAEVEFKSLEELRQENFDLNDKIKDFEVNSLYEVKEAYDLLKITKSQIMREKSLGTFRVSPFEQKMIQMAELKNFLLSEISIVNKEIQACIE